MAKFLVVILGSAVFLSWVEAANVAGKFVLMASSPRTLNACDIGDNRVCGTCDSMLVKKINYLKIERK